MGDLRPSYTDLAALVSEGLDLCVRARQIDLAHKQRAAREAFPASAEEYPQAFPLCMTPYLWLLDQYDADLADWEQRARKAMTLVTFPTTPWEPRERSEPQPTQDKE